MSDSPIVVWHRADLRLSDNPALHAAAEDGRPVPMFIFDPTFYTSGMACDARLRFMHEALESLERLYEKAGTQLVYRHGNALDVLRELEEKDIEVYFNHDTNAGYGQRRDKAVLSLSNTTVFGDDGIVRGADDSRDGWQEQAEEYFKTPYHPAPWNLTTHSFESDTTIESVEETYEVQPSKTDVPRGGVEPAWERLTYFTSAIDEYAGGISPPAEAEEKTSHLSAYLKFGCLSPRQAYQHVQTAADGGRGVGMFTSRLFWNRHFTQKLEDWPKATKQAINPVFRGMNRDRHDQELVNAWKEGRTGFPLVDASMRALKQTGWLNFRMRAMCASFYTYVLRGWWKEGADYFYKHLIDADSAINYQQWQMQSGLVGVHPNRVYNPRKQVRDNDPDGTFIKRYVTELEDVPAKYLDQPEKMPVSKQQELDVIIGEDYPLPVVDFERRAKEAREEYAMLSGRAREALEDPEIRRRASLSRRGGEASDLDDEEEEPEASGQRTLDSF